MPRGTVIFLSYGQGPHVAETVFAAFSAWRLCRVDRHGRLLIYTDTPAYFSDVPVDIRTISTGELQHWQPPGAYPRHCKTAVLRDALQTFDHPVAMVDSDTWFRLPPHRILDRVTPGRVALHLDEGPLAASNCPVKRAFVADLPRWTFHDSRGAQIVVSDRDGMWNSGVTGIHPADTALLDDTLTLVDQLWQAFPRRKFLEQFALSATVVRVTRPRPTEDIVYHYWPEVLRQPWRERLPELLADTSGLSPGARAEVLHRHRPRARGHAAARFAAKQALRSVGLQTPGVRSSAS